MFFHVQMHLKGLAAYRGQNLCSQCILPQWNSLNLVMRSYPGFAKVLKFVSFSSNWVLELKIKVLVDPLSLKIGVWDKNSSRLQSSFHDLRLLIHFECITLIILPSYFDSIKKKKNDSINYLNWYPHHRFIYF